MPRKKAARRQAALSPPSTPPAVVDPRVAERSLQHIHRLLEARNFVSIDEANAFLQAALLGGGLPELPPETPLEEAQELVYQAWQEPNPARRKKLAREALNISPDCTDAYVVLAEATRDARAAKAFYEQGLAAFARACGPEIFEEGAGDFWGIFETRPYMRARLGLAQTTWALGEREVAIAHLQEMLRLNPNDNQGTRYLLVTWLLTVGDDKTAAHVVGRYPQDWSAAWAYTRALLAFRRQGASQAANKALRLAFDVNRWVVQYLLGAQRLPRQLPTYRGLGDESEAIHYVAANYECWLGTPGAIEWFHETIC